MACFLPALMDTTLFTSIVFFGSLLAGFLGALTGLGGGVVVVPLLTLALGVDIRYAVGASLVSVIATSSGAAAAYVREGFSNIRIGMFLEIATTLGALLGAYLATRLQTSIIGVVFGAMLLFSAYFSSREHTQVGGEQFPDHLAHWLKLEGSYPAMEGQQEYHAQRVPLGFGMMFGAGTLSGLLGIGSGAMKVLAMDQAMKLPFKVSTTTSNFMIGVTAAASAGIYLSRGFIDPGLAMPVMLGVLAGSMMGAKVLVKAETRYIRIVFSLVIVALAIEMIVTSIRGRL
ncbi:MAG: sulfite exporter TauE/SafE family protein [Candidatus Acidiferrum sp.]